MARPTKWSWAGLLALGVLTACDGGAAPGPVRPNVLLISLDSTRRDLLSCYGHTPLHAPGRATSPNLDRLAAEGVLFRDAYANSSWTLVSHMSLMTGLAPLEHGVDDSFQTYAGAAPLLAELLQAAGYRTAGFYSGPLLEPHYGFGRGFERYEACYGADLARASGLAARLREERDATEDASEFERVAREFRQAQAELMSLAHVDVSSRVVTDAVLDELDRRAGDPRPFFLFAHYFDPHYDYVPPAEHDVFDEAYGGTIDGKDFLTSALIAGPKLSVQPRERRVSERDLQHVLALYEAELAWTDSEVGRILARLERQGLLDDTLVIVTSDHGDEFFEHGSIGHRRTLYEEVVRVPLVARHPGLLPRGVEVDGLVSLADVPATVLELLGLDPLAGRSGRSAVPMLRGDASEPGARSVVYRVVQSHSVQLSAQGHGKFPGTQFVVSDAFRHGPIKILRTVNWSRPRDPVPGLDVEALVAARRAHETLLWTDVEQHPDEESGVFAHDFADPRARAALAAFRAAYELQQRRRVPAAISKGRQRFTAMLKGLGYVEGEEESEDDSGTSEDYVLPPPGERLLGAAATLPR